MMVRMVGKWTLPAVVMILAGCNILSEDVESRPSPSDTLAQILRMHGVEGRSLNERPPEFQKAAVDREVLSRIFMDYAAEDPFLANLYVGFIVGVLAEHQNTLQVKTKGLRSEVRAGKARIFMHLHDKFWRISLTESIPDAVKARAKMEKLRVANK